MTSVLGRRHEPTISTDSKTISLDPLWDTLVLIVGFAFTPMGSVMLCAWIANAHGCKVDEGSVHPCIINGQAPAQTKKSFGLHCKISGLREAR
jgi:hypothetical protein